VEILTRHDRKFSVGDEVIVPMWAAMNALGPPQSGLAAQRARHGGSLVQQVAKLQARSCELKQAIYSDNFGPHGVVAAYP
jgi:hypothetical protein